MRKAIGIGEIVTNLTFAAAKKAPSGQERADSDVTASLLAPLKRMANSLDLETYVLLGVGAAATVAVQKLSGWIFSPRLHVSYDSSKERYNQEVDGSRWFRFKVSNSGLDTAIGVVAEVQKVFKVEDGKEIENTASRTTVLQCLRKEVESKVENTDAGVNLHRGQCEYWGLAYKPIGGNSFTISTYRDMLHKKMGNPIEFSEGTYILDVSVFSERQEATEVRFQVVNRGKEGITVERYQKPPLWSIPVPITRNVMQPMA